MSLTSFIEEREVRDKFREYFPLPKLDLNDPIKAEPLTKNYSLVGIAFDYLIRFFIQRNNPKAISKGWVAESAVTMAPDEFESKYIKLLTFAKKNYEKYLSDGKLTVDLIKSVIYLGQMDVLYRAGIVHESLGFADPGDIKDIENLYSLLDPNQFKANELCLLNPTFGQGSVIVDGADADLILDNTLVDIKTTNFLTLKEKDYHQLIGYYILSLFGEISDAPKDWNITHLSIYFSRHGVLFKFLTPSEQSKYAKISDSRRDEFVKWFIERTRSQQDL
jgi:hypothetical protein